MTSPSANQERRPLRKWLGYFLALFSEAKSFRDNPIIGSQRLNRMGLHVLRVIISHGVLRLRWLLLSPLVSHQDRRCFLKNGYIVKENILSEQQLTDLKCTFNEHLPRFRQMHQGDTITHLLPLNPEQFSAVAALQQLTENRRYLNLQRYASGFFLLPWLYFLRIENGVRQTTDQRDPQKVIHADSFHPTMKSWLFLEDVTASHGPFTYYPGSHRLNWRRLKWEYKRSLQAGKLEDGYSEKGSFRIYPNDIKQLGLESPKSFTVPANTLVIANTFGFHCRGDAVDGAKRDAIWSSGWRAPFLVFPLPDGLWLRQFFYRRLNHFLNK